MRNAEWKAPAIGRRQSHVYTHSSATQRAMGQLVSWIVGQVRELSGGNEVVAERLFECARNFIEQVDVTRFEGNEMVLRGLVREAMEKEQRRTAVLHLSLANWGTLRRARP